MPAGRTGLGVVDGNVFISAADKPWKRYKVGDIVSVRVTGSDAHDLWGDVA